MRPRRSEVGFFIWFGCVALVALGMFGGVVFVVAHFLLKFW